MEKHQSMEVRGTVDVVSARKDPKSHFTTSSDEEYKDDERVSEDDLQIFH